MKKNKNKELSSRGRAESSDVLISCDKVLMNKKNPEKTKTVMPDLIGYLSRFFNLIRRSLEFFAFAQVAPAKNRDDSLLFLDSPWTRFSEIATSAFRLLAMTIPTLALAMVLAIANVSESRADIVGCNDGDNNCESCGSGCNWSYDTETKSLSLSGNGATYTSIKVDSGDGRNLPWANYMNEIETIRVAPGSSLEIGDGAFFEATSLISVDMPNVKKIGDFAFDGATSLTSVDMPNVTTIGWGGF